MIYQSRQSKPATGTHQIETKLSKQKARQDVYTIQTPYIPKIDQVQHLQNTIHQLQIKNRQLLMELKQTQLKVHTSQFSQNLSAKFDEILRNRNEATIKQIQQLNQQNSQLKIQILQIDGKKIEKKQINQPSLLTDYKGSIEKKLGSQTDILRLKTQIQYLNTQNKNAKDRLSKVSEDYKKFVNKYMKDYDDLNSKYQSQQAKNSDLTQQIFKIKQSERITLQNLNRKEGQLQSIKNRNKVYYSYFKEILNSVPINEAQNKLSTYLNTLTAQQLQDNKKRAKIKEIINQDKNKYNDLQARNKNNEEQKISFQRSLKQKEENIKLIQKQLSTIKDRMLNIEQNLRKETTNKSQLMRQKDSLLQLKSEHLKKIFDLEENIKKMTSNIDLIKTDKKKNQQIMSLKISQLQATKLANQKTIEKQLTDINILNSKAQNLDKNIQGLKTDKSEMQKKIIKLQQDISLHLADIQSKKKTITDFEKTVINLRQEIIKLKDDIKDLNKEGEKSRNEIARLSSQQKILKQKITKLQQDIDSLNRNVSQQKYTSAQRKTMLEKINKELIGQASYYYLGTSQVFKSISSESLKGLTPQISGTLASWKDSYNRAKFFNGSQIINKDNIRFVLDSLDDFMGCTPSESKLIYKYDPLNLVNFHNYFDRVDNLIVFIKISNGTIIGGFTVYPVDPERIHRPGRGFLFSLTGRKVYPLRAQPKLPVVSYDNYYFLFGNAEIRLKSQEKKVFSNFGIANSTFDNGNEPRTSFLNVKEMSDNYLDIDTYEFYKMNFKL